MYRFFSTLGSDLLVEILKQSSDAMAIYTGSDLKIQLVNDAMLAIWGKDQSIHGMTFEEALPEMKGQEFITLLKNVWYTGQLFEAKDSPATLEIHGKMVTSYFDFTYKPIVNAKGEVYCILHTAKNVTERVKAWKAVREKEQREQLINEELRLLNEELQASNQELASLNEEYQVTNEQLDYANQKIFLLNDQLKRENSELIFDNREFQDNISDLGYSNKMLEYRNQELEELNSQISQLNRQLSESQVSFSDLIAQAPVAMMLLKGDDFIVTMINTQMLELIDKDVSIIEQPFFEVMPELKGQPAANRLIETFTHQRPYADYSNPVTLNRNGGLEEGFFNFTYTPFIENGIVTGVIDIAIEVTPQVRAIQNRDLTIAEKSKLEEVLRDSERRLQSMLETMAEGVCVVDAVGKVTYANPMAKQILGVSELELRDRTYNDPKWQNFRVDGSSLRIEEHPMYRMLKTGQAVFDSEIAIHAPGRDPLYICVNTAPIFDDAGRVTGGIGTFMDVTSRRLIMQGKDDFISIASHELKNPVTALKGSLQLLQKSHHKLTEDVRSKLLQQSIKSLEKLSLLIADLLDTSRIEQGHLKIDKKSIVLSKLFVDCCADILKETNQKIIFEGDENYTVEADNQQVGQVMLNFITNAIKYAPSSEKIIVRVIRINEEEIKVSVIDNGPGIPQDKIDHLFKRYYRTDYNGQKFSGLGLGLYISAEIIKNHGGRIGVNSDSLTGSEFWFTLPSLQRI